MEKHQKGTASGSISPRMAKVINNYMKGMTQQDALEKAGYSRLSARDVFMRQDVIEEIKRRQRLAAKRADVDLDWIVERLKSIANAELTDALDIYSDGSAKVNLNKLNPDLRRALNKISTDIYTEGRGKNANEVKSVRISSSDKLRALELLVRHLGLSKEKIVVEGEIDLVERLQRGRNRVGSLEVVE